MIVQEHYKQHLSQIYGWMIGDFNSAQQVQQAIFERHNIQPIQTGLALDLGCGNGLQSFSLSNLGFTVHAVDTDAGLLEELNTRNNSHNKITTHQSTIADYLFNTVQPVDAIVCMGDTLTHLESTAAIKALFHKVYDLLVSGGMFILSFRDYSNALSGTQRFIPVRSDESRILTCFLEYTDDHHVMVHDIVHEHTPAGWTQRVSSYPKLRLGYLTVIQWLQESSLMVRNYEEISKMHYIVAEKV